MKKIMAIVLSAVVLCSMLTGFAITANAAGSLTLAVNSATAKRGENVTINVTASNATNVGGLIINLGYDSSKLEYVSSVKGAGMTMSTTAVVHIPANNEVRLTALDGSDAWSGSGVILTATFKVKDTATGTAAVKIKDNFDIADFQFNVITPAITNGVVTVDVPLTGISLNKSTTTLNKSETETLTITKNPTDTTDTSAATWTSSNTNVATVANGVVTAVGGGSAIITATISGKTATCAVTVNAPLTSISLNKTTSALKKNQTETLTVTYNPTDTTDSKTVVWTSSEETVATVVNGVVTAKKAGTATITATVNGKTATCAYTITEIPLKGIAMNKATTEIAKGDTDTLTIIKNPEDTTDDIGAITWTSSDTKVATVENGIVTAKAVGTSTITATVNGKTATCEVTVVLVPLTGITLDKTTADLEIGKTLTLTPTFTPSNTTDDKKITWTSSEEAVATVVNGVVTAKKAGKVTITATCGELTAKCVITVKAPVLDENNNGSNNNGSNINGNNNNSGGNSNPNTSDNAPIVPLVLVLFASLGALTMLLAAKKHKIK